MTDNKEEAGIFFYVAHHMAKEFEAVGWVFSTDLGPPHCAYASLYRWEGEGTPIIPEPKPRKKDDIFFS